MQFQNLKRHKKVTLGWIKKYCAGHVTRELFNSYLINFGNIGGSFMDKNYQVTWSVLMTSLIIYPNSRNWTGVISGEKIQQKFVWGKIQSCDFMIERYHVMKKSHPQTFLVRLTPRIGHFKFLLDFLSRNWIFVQNSPIGVKWSVPGF